MKQSRFLLKKGINSVCLKIVLGLKRKKTIVLRHP